MRTEGVGSVWDDGDIYPWIPSMRARGYESGPNSPGAGLYVLIDSRENTVLYAMTRDRLMGTNDWTKAELIFDVPDQSELITLGFFLAGKGKLWAAGFGFESNNEPINRTFDLDLTSTQQYVDEHKKRLKGYGRSPDAPVLRITER